MSKNTNNENTKLCIKVLAIILIPAVLCILGLHFILALLIALGLFGLLYYFETNKEKFKQKKEREKAQKKQKLINFYEKCKNAGVTFPLTQDQMKVLRSVSETFEDLGYLSLEEAYNSGYQETLKLQRDNEQEVKEIVALILEEGINTKYIKGLNDEFIETWNEYLSIMDNCQHILINNTKAQAVHRDWATAGGIAEAIGGVGLGIAVAMDIQQKNIDAERIAQENRELAYEAIMEAASYDKKVQAEARKVVQKLNEFDLKYSQHLKLENVNNIKYNVNSYYVRESGTMLVNISPNNKNFDPENALDGFLFIIIKHNNEVVGEGYLYSPGYLYDFNKDDGKKLINQIGLENFEDYDIICFAQNGHIFNSENKYEFEFVATKAWHINLKNLEKDYFDLCNTYENYYRVRQYTIRNSAVSAFTTTPIK